MDEKDRMIFEIITTFPNLPTWKKALICMILIWESAKHQTYEVIQWALSFPEWLLNKIGIR